MFKDLFKTNLPKVLELLGGIILSALISGVVCFFIGSKTGFAFLANAVVAIIFYYFGGMIRPYIMELVAKITKNIGKKDEKKVSKKK